MPFIVRCPHCRKFMLIEDERRGSTGPCLLCKQPVLFQAAPKAAESPPVGQSTSETIIRVCPGCQASLKVPASAKHSRVMCPKCRTQFD